MAGDFPPWTQVFGVDRASDYLIGQQWVFDPPIEKRPLKIVWTGIESTWPTESEAAAEIQGFNAGIESAALHVENMGLKLVAREIRDLKRKTES